MFGNTFVAFAAAVGVAIWVYRKTAIRGGVEFKKQIAPAAISAILTFFVAMTILWSLG